MTLPLQLYRWLAPRLIARRLPKIEAAMAEAGFTARIPERMGHASLPRPPGRLIWLHGASVGEGLTLLDLAAALRAADPALQCLLTTGTIGAAKVIPPRLTEGLIHQFAPLDTPDAVARFLTHWRPDLAILAESEIWPNTLAALRRADIPTALVNARLSGSSLRLWQRLPRSARKVFGSFGLIHSQDDASHDVLLTLAPEAEMLRGENLKAAAAPLPADATALAALHAAIGTRPVWCAASTHKGEEELILAAHRDLLDDHPDLLLILCPRHPDRAEEIMRLTDLHLSRRSTGALPDAQTQVYLADTFGEMGLWFRLARLTLLGGSLVDGIGGHNPWEPARLGAAFVSGPFVVNAAPDFAALTAAGATRMVDPNALVDAIADLLYDDATRDSMAQAGATLVRQQAALRDALVQKLIARVKS